LFPLRERGGLGWGSLLCNFILNWYYSTTASLSQSPPILRD
jgi:hypothetical protein